MKELETIVILNDFGSINGGAAKVAIQSASSLAQKGYRVIYFCAVGPIDEELMAVADKVICLDQKDILHSHNRIRTAIRGIWNRKAYFELEKIIKTLDPDTTAYHVHGWSKALTASVFATMKKNNIIPFVTLHDYFSVCPNGGFYNYVKDSKCRLKPMGIKCLFCNCDKRSYLQKIWRCIRQFIQNRYIKDNPQISYIYISDFSFEKMRIYLKSKHCFYLANACDSLHTHVERPSENHTYYYIGRMSQEKGIDLFLDAITTAGVDGRVIGDGMDIGILQTKYPSVQFEGWKNHEQIRELIQQARCLVYPSRWYEGSPLTIPEILECGIPCIVPDNCAAADFIQNEVNGLIYDPNDAEGLKKAILKVEKADSTNALFKPEQWTLNFCSLDSHIQHLILIYKTYV